MYSVHFVPFVLGFIVLIISVLVGVLVLADTPSASSPTPTPTPTPSVSPSVPASDSGSLAKNITGGTTNDLALYTVDFVAAPTLTFQAAIDTLTTLPVTVTTTSNTATGFEVSVDTGRTALGTTVTGAEMATLVVLDAGFMYTVADNRPAAIIPDSNSQLFYQLATEALGNSWPGTTVAPFSSNAYRGVSMSLDSSGIPLFASWIVSGASGTPVFTRFSDIEGASNPVAEISAQESSGTYTATSVIEVAGRPAVFYGTSATFEVRFRRSANEDGTSVGDWSVGSPIATVDTINIARIASRMFDTGASARVAALIQVYPEGEILYWLASDNPPTAFLNTRLIGSGNGDITELNLNSNIFLNEYAGRPIAAFQGPSNLIKVSVGPNTTGSVSWGNLGGPNNNIDVGSTNVVGYYAFGVSTVDGKISIVYRDSVSENIKLIRSTDNTSIPPTFEAPVVMDLPAGTETVLLNDNATGLMFGGPAATYLARYTPSGANQAFQDGFTADWTAEGEL